MKTKQCIAHGIEYSSPNCPVCFAKERLLCTAPDDGKYADDYRWDYRRIKTSQIGGQATGMNF